MHLFIADLHLSAESTLRNAAFLNFLAEGVTSNDTLYILGDLFDFWVGDDDLTPFNLSIIEGLRQLKERGVTCYLIQGNRDFMLAKRFAALSGVTLLPECYILALSTQRILLLHGDLFCTDDKGYQRFRRVMHCGILQRLFLCLPLSIRRKIGQSIRGNSEMANQKKSNYLLDVNRAAVMEYAEIHQVDTIIHGHTHRVLQEFLPLNNEQSVQRIVLGSWEQQAWILKLDDCGGLTQHHFDIEQHNK